VWENFPAIRWAYHQLPTKTGHLQRVFQRFSRVRSNESSEVTERSMGIERTSEAWEVLNIPIPFSSRGHAATSSVSQSKMRGARHLPA
jgi:hypothetical protein